MHEGQLVPNGDPSLAVANSYEFTASLVIRTGEADRRVHEWTLTEGVLEPYHIQPGEMVWIRPNERVALPSNICAFWWQTNRLSRHGLLMLNTSMVEPGYDGNLACLFVNFGQHAVSVYPHTRVAKLVFVQLSSAATQPHVEAIPSEAYDEKLQEAATHSPSTFLNVAELMPSIRDRQDELLRELRSATEDAKSELGSERRRQLTELQSDVRRPILKALWPVVLLFIVVVLAINFVPQVREALVPIRETEIERAVERQLNRQLDSPN